MNFITNPLSTSQATILIHTFTFDIHIFQVFPPFQLYTVNAFYSSLPWLSLLLHTHCILLDLSTATCIDTNRHWGLCPLEITIQPKHTYQKSKTQYQTVQLHEQLLKTRKTDYHVSKYQWRTYTKRFFMLIYKNITNSIFHLIYLHYFKLLLPQLYLQKQNSFTVTEQEASSCVTY